MIRKGKKTSITARFHRICRYLCPTPLHHGSRAHNFQSSLCVYFHLLRYVVYLLRPKYAGLLFLLDAGARRSIPPNSAQSREEVTH